jgi:phenylacetate-CoA ligase
VVQEAVDRIHVRIVVDRAAAADDSVRAADLREIEDKIRLVMGDCAIRFSMCETIEPTASGKFRYTISNVSDEHSYSVT